MKLLLTLVLGVALMFVANADDSDESSDGSHDSDGGESHSCHSLNHKL